MDSIISLVTANLEEGKAVETLSIYCDPRTWSVQSKNPSQATIPSEYLHSLDSDENIVCLVKVQHGGSKPRLKFKVYLCLEYLTLMQIITMISGTLFKKVAAVAKLKKKNFKKADKIPHTYDQMPFSLDGSIYHVGRQDITPKNKKIKKWMP